MRGRLAAGGAALPESSVRPGRSKEKAAEFKERKAAASMISLIFIILFNQKSRQSRMSRKYL